MNARKRVGIFSIVLALITLVSLLIGSAFADTDGADDWEQALLAYQQEDFSEYQLILDKLNAEFGTDAHLITPQESIDTGIPLPSLKTLPPLEEFENEMRSICEGASESNRIARENFARAMADPDCIVVRQSVEDGDGYYVRDANGRIVGTNFRMIDCEALSRAVEDPSFDKTVPCYWKQDAAGNWYPVYVELDAEGNWHPINLP